MRIVVLSDTHMPQRAPRLPEALVREIETADALIHAGDFTSYVTFLDFKAFEKPFYAVRGNMDDGDIAHELPDQLIFDLEGKHIALTHGWGAPDDLELRVIRRLQNENPDVIIFGHSHRSVSRVHGSILVLNPGSPTDTVFAKSRSFAVLTLNPKDLAGVSSVRAEIVPLP